MTFLFGLFRLSCFMLLAGLSLAVQAQTGSPADGPPPKPLASAVELRLAGAHRFRVGVVVNNAGDFPDKLGHLGTLLGDGSVVPVAEGFFWRIVINRSQVDGHALGDNRPLVTIDMVTDAHGALQGQEVNFSSLVRDDPEGRRHSPYLMATAMSLGGVASMVLPAAALRQGAALGSLQTTVAGILNYMEPGVKLSTPMPTLVVTGSRVVQGRQAVHATARGPVSFLAALGAATVQSESQVDIAMDSGLPLTSLLKLNGRLPAGYGQMDFSVRATLRPY